MIALVLLLLQICAVLLFCYLAFTGFKRLFVLFFYKWSPAKAINGPIVTSKITIEPGGPVSMLFVSLFIVVLNICQPNTNWQVKTTMLFTIFLLVALLVWFIFPLLAILLRKLIIKVKKLS